MVTTGSNRVVVGFDDSEGSRRAAAWAAAVGQHTGADVLLLLKRPMFIAMCTGGTAGNGLGRAPLVQVNYGPSQLIRRK